MSISVAASNSFATVNHEINDDDAFKGYVVWGLIFSAQPPFYPAVAELKGATPSQVMKVKL